MGLSLQLTPLCGPDVLSLEPAPPCLCYTAGVLSPDQTALLAHVPCREAGMPHPDGAPGCSRGRCLVLGLGNALAPSMTLLCPDGGASLPSPGFIVLRWGAKGLGRAAVQHSMISAFRPSLAIGKNKRRH